MEDIKYSISDAAQKIGVETHVLRYWEDELKLTIPRNELGRRYYTDEDIYILNKIKSFKEQGLQLKAIKDILSKASDIYDIDNARIQIENQKSEGQVIEFRKNNVSNEPQPEYKMERFKEIMTDIIKEAMAQNKQEFAEEITKSVSNNVIKELNYIMMLNEEKEEERFRNIDEVIRSTQKNRQETAASKEKKKKKRFKIF